MVSYKRKRSVKSSRKYGKRIGKRPKYVGKSYRPRSRPILNTGAKMSYMSARCPILFNISVDTTSMTEQNAIRLMIPWQQLKSGGGIPGTTILNADFKMTDRYTQCKANWKQFAIKGLKIDWIPKATLPANNQIAAESLTYNVGIQDIGLGTTKNSSKLLMESGNHPLVPRARFRKWLPMKALSKTQHLDWQECTQVVTDRTTLSDAWSMLIWKLSGDVA